MNTATLWLSHKINYEKKKSVLRATDSMRKGTKQKMVACQVSICYVTIRSGVTQWSGVAIQSKVNEVKSLLCRGAHYCHVRWNILAITKMFWLICEIGRRQRTRSTTWNALTQEAKPYTKKRLLDVTSSFLESSFIHSKKKSCQNKPPKWR